MRRHARYYRNVWGRFTTVDPLVDVSAVGDPQRWNRYAYALNSPMRYTDPLGLCVPGDCRPENSLNYMFFMFMFGRYPPIYGEQPPGREKNLAGPGRQPKPQDPDPPTPPNAPKPDPPKPSPPKPADPPKPGLFDRAKSVFCGTLPSGRAVGLSGTLGLTVGGTGSLEQVVNYRTGDVSYFASGGLQAGWNGGAQGNALIGTIYGDLGRNNVNYSKWFTGKSASYGLAGGFWQSSSTLTSGGLTLGTNVLAEVTPFTFGVSQTYYSQPVPGGNVFSNGSSLDQLVFWANQLCR